MNNQYILYILIAIMVAAGGYLLYAIFTKPPSPDIYDTDNSSSISVPDQTI